MSIQVTISYFFYLACVRVSRMQAVVRGAPNQGVIFLKIELKNLLYLKELLSGLDDISSCTFTKN